MKHKAIILSVLLLGLAVNASAGNYWVTNNSSSDELRISFVGFDGNGKLLIRLKDTPLPPSGYHHSGGIYFADAMVDTQDKVKTLMAFLLGIQTNQQRIKMTRDDVTHKITFIRNIIEF